MGLALDVGMIFDLKRRQQAAADAGAFGAAQELFRGNSALVTKAAWNDAAINGWKHNELSGGDSDVTVTVNYPLHLSGDHGLCRGDRHRNQRTHLFLRVVGRESATVQSRAVAGLVKSYGDGAASWH